MLTKEKVTVGKIYGGVGWGWVSRVGGGSQLGKWLAVFNPKDRGSHGRRWRGSPSWTECRGSGGLGGGWGSRHLTGLRAPQLEKVLQQGDISECCEPYMVMKEVDTAKVPRGGWSGPPAGRGLGR